MACVLPLSAILALAGFEWIMEKLQANKAIYLVFGACIILLVAYKPFTYNRIPTKTGINFAVMEELANWVKTSPYKNRTAFYTDPMFPFYMDADPFDNQKCAKVYTYENIDPATLLKPGDLLIWDAQFSGYEGHLPFDSIMKNNNLRLLNIFSPVESFTIIGGEKYKLAVFMKAPRDTSRIYHSFYFNDFETVLPEVLKKQVSTDFSHSGKQSILLTPDNIYSPSTEDKLKYLPDSTNISLRASVWILNPSAIEKGQILLVVSVNDTDFKAYKYFAAKDDETTYKPGEWFKITRTEVIDRKIPVDGTYKVYVWYTGKNKIYVDDLSLEYMPVGY